MDQELFNPQSSSVSSSRIIYTPSTFCQNILAPFARGRLFAGCSPTCIPVVSFLCFIVLSGKGELSYEEQTYQLSEGDCVFMGDANYFTLMQWCVDNDFCGEAAKAVRYDSDFV